VEKNYVQAYFQIIDISYISITSRNYWCCWIHQGSIHQHWGQVSSDLSRWWWSYGSARRTNFTI